MCYSAMCWQAFRDFEKVHGATLSIKDFAALYGFRRINPKVKIPRAMDRNFDDPQTDDERAIKAIIDEFNKAQLTKWEQELFKQKRRLADAERVLATKPTKKAADDQRVSTSKIEQLLGWITDAKRTEAKPRDSRIYPQHYAPVMVWENGRRVVKPMRYQCRLQGWNADIEKKYPGTYNARLDNLEKSWGKHWGINHGVMIVTEFFENVSRHTMEHRDLAPGEKEENVVLQFKPAPRRDMLIACLWSDWAGPGEEPLLSFAAITDEPPPEVLAAGHDRCIISIKQENVDRWLQPGGDLAAMYTILKDPDRPFYEHRIAA